MRTPAGVRVSAYDVSERMSTTESATRRSSQKRLSAGTAISDSCRRSATMSHCDETYRRTSRFVKRSEAPAASKSMAHSKGGEEPATRLRYSLKKRCAR